MWERSLSKLLKIKLLNRSPPSSSSSSTNAPMGAETDPGVTPACNSSSLPPDHSADHVGPSSKSRPISPTSFSCPIDSLSSRADPETGAVGVGVDADADAGAGADAGADAVAVTLAVTTAKSKQDLFEVHHLNTSAAASDEPVDPENIHHHIGNSVGIHVPEDSQLSSIIPISTSIHSVVLPAPHPSTVSHGVDVASVRETLPEGQSLVVNNHPGAQLTPSLVSVEEQPSASPLRVPQIPPTTTAGGSRRPSLAVRRQSLLPASQQHLVKGLLEPGLLSQYSDQFISPSPLPNVDMAQQRIWVKRPNASATLVSVTEDGVVDELRDQVLRKYQNSLGRSFDSPDLLIKIAPREGSNRHSTPERTLNPEEPVSSLLDLYYPGGQTVDEALIVDLPQRRTPKPSPRQGHHHTDLGEHSDYFPPMPANPNPGTPPGHLPSSMSAVGGVSSHPAPSISVLATGKVPPLPSPGGRTSRHPRRPAFPRHSTNSPTLLGSSPVQKDTNGGGNSQNTSTGSSLPTPPGPAPESPRTNTFTPPARVTSPRPNRKPKKGNGSSTSAAFGGLIEGTVPPINVLIVEDNVINQKLLEAFMKRLSVRWQCAPNGEVAVRKWRQGGFHLVLMDIQLPVMNGLEAAKEIRRLERLNGIGVFSKTASGRSSTASISGESPPEDATIPMRKEDVLENISLFRSPVIIVALTASSLQSDRHEALAAGCNDFLTKPVRFPWLEQKVTEWGCMQALIDFEGWRKWRGFVDSHHGTASPAGSSSTIRVASNGTPRKALPETPTPMRSIGGGATVSMQAPHSGGSPGGKVGDRNDHGVDNSSGSRSGEADGVDLRIHTMDHIEMRERQCIAAD